MFIPPIVGYGTLMVVAIGMAILISRGSLSRNRAIGIRTKHTLRSDEAWRAAHEAGLPYLIAIAIVSGAYAVTLLTVELGDYSETLGNILALTGYLIVVTITLISWRAADKSAKAASPTTGQ